MADSKNYLRDIKSIDELNKTDIQWLLDNYQAKRGKQCERYHNIVEEIDCECGKKVFQSYTKSNVNICTAHHLWQLQRSCTDLQRNKAQTYI